MKKHLINICNFLKRFFGKKEETMPNPIPTPNPLPDPGIYLSAKQVREELTKQLAGKLSGSAKIYLPDENYYLPSLDYTKKVLLESTTDKRKYIAEIQDCDDFAVLVKADFITDAYRNGTRRAPHAMGICWGLLPGPHALNWVLNADMVVRLVEPQTDSVFTPRDTDKGIWLLFA